MARHTFATSVTLTNGGPIESVSKMLGHKNIQITQHDARVLDKKVSEDMQNLRAKFYWHRLASASERLRTKRLHNVAFLIILKSR
ncbi:MAG: hypothetical protein EOO51_07690 [Flavobacterium sp.]|nr:MAG: hypothetical protein EOO51_07690 [Flavobacterium sp.]